MDCHTKKHLATGAVLVAFLSFANLARAGDGFVKGGFILHPSFLDSDQRWIVSVGGDWRLGAVYAGVELQTAYQSYTTGGKISLRVIPLNPFFNVKLKSEASDLRPFASGGIGLVTGVIWTEVLVSGFEDTTEFDVEPAFHFSGGFELNERFVLELLVQRTFRDSLAFENVNGSLALSPWTELNWTVLGGVTW